MLVQKIAHLKFNDPAHNHSKDVDPELLEADIIWQFKECKVTIPNTSGLLERKCIDVEVEVKIVEPITQEAFQKVFDEYCADLKDKGVHPFCSNVKALSSWVSQDLKLDHCSWDFLKDTVNDMFDTPQSIGIIEDQKFVLFNFERTEIFSKVGQKVRSCNDGSYGKNEPKKCIGDSFYNRDGHLIFWASEKQKQRLTKDIEYIVQKDLAWHEWNVVKSQINDTTFIPMPEIVAMYMLEAVPPVRMKCAHRFLVGEAAEHNTKGESVYVECRRVSKDKWEAKHTTVKEFDSK